MRRTLALVVVAGLAVGAFGRACDHLDEPAWRWVSALGAPWLALAFAVGALAGTTKGRAALAAGASLALGVLTYYALFRFAEHRTSTLYAAAMGVGWSAAALPVGAAFGWAGASWRERRGPLAAGVLAGALLGEALLLRTLWTGPTALRVLHVEALLGVLAALLLTRARMRALVAGLAVAGGVVVAEEAVRQTLRAAGWAGA